MSDNQISVIFQVKSLKTKRDLENAISSLAGIKINEGKTGDLLIKEIGDDPNAEFREIEELKQKGEVKEIFLTSASTDPRLLIRALRSGIKEFFSQPIGKDEVRSAVLNFFERSGKINPQLLKRGKIITVAGARGGIGTSTVAVNLAASLSELDEIGPVALMDTVAVFSDASIFLDVHQSAFSWLELFNNLSRLDRTYIMSTVPKHESGVYVLPAPPNPVDEAADLPAEDLSMLLDTLRGTFDYIVVDAGKSLDRVNRTLYRESDKVLAVSILTLPSISSTRRLLEQFKRLGLFQSEIEIVVNRVQKNSLISIKDAESAIGKKALAALPNDYRTAISALNQGKPISTVAAGSELARGIRNLAMLVSGKSERAREKTGLFSLKRLSSSF